MAADNVRLGIIGLGYMAQGVHMPCFATAKGCTLAAVADRDGDLADRVAKKWGIARSFADEKELLASDEIDAVVILVPPQFIAATAMEALKHGKHVFCEKPLALTTDVNDAVVKAAGDADRTVFVAYQKRYDTGVQYLHDFLANTDDPRRAELGKITSARFHNYCGSFRGTLERPYEKSDTQVDYAAVGGVDLPDWVTPEDGDMFFCSYVNGSHDLNLMRFLLGQPQGVAGGFRIATACAWFPYSTTLFDYGSYCASFEYGLVRYNEFDEWAQIYFEGGWVKLQFGRVLLDGQPATVEIMTETGGRIAPPIPHSWSFRRQAEQFVQCCLGQATPLTDATETLGDTILGQSWYQATETRPADA